MNKKDNLEFEAYGESLESHPDFLSLKQEYEFRQLQSELNEEMGNVNKADTSYPHKLESQDFSLIFDTPIQENLIDNNVTQTLKNDEVVSLEENVVSKIDTEQ
jgi:hypothetical protein